MRLVLLSLFLAFGSLYAAGAYHSYREELRARETGVEPSSEGFSHPEANLRLLRDALDAGDFSNRLLPHLERSLAEGPSFYQPPLLLAAFYANRLERPDLVREGFEAAVARFPSNGRLHLTYAEWLLGPRPSAPYRSFREVGSSDSRGMALSHIAVATRLEPELGRQAVELMLRFEVPVEEWPERLPRTEAARVWILEGLERATENHAARKALLEEFLKESSTTTELPRSIAHYAERWGEPELARDAASRWREAALERKGDEIARATVSLARLHLASGEGDRAYELLRETLALMEERSVPQESALELLCALGEEYRIRGRHAMAQALFSEALALSPYHPPAHLGMARNFRALGDLESARRELRELLSFDPSNHPALRELEELDRLSQPRR